MAKNKEVKTNAMRILDRMKLSYDVHSYDCAEFADGVTVAQRLGLDPDTTFKTLVAEGKSGAHYCFVIPVAAELDLKAAAKSVAEKSVELVHVKDLFALTGYVRGGCTCIGMKKQFVTVIQENARGMAAISVSGGKLGTQITLAPSDLAKAAGASFADIIMH